MASRFDTERAARHGVPRLPFETRRRRKAVTDATARSYGRGRGLRGWFVYGRGMVMRSLFAFETAGGIPTVHVMLMWARAVAFKII